jgi:hypothetical protein
MRGLVTTIAPVVVLVEIGLLLSASAGYARPDYTRRTKKECGYCHPPDSWRLTEAGKYFRDHRTLDGFRDAPETKK